MSSFNYPLTTYATLGSLSLYIATALNAGSKRVKGGVKAPAVTGDENFEVALRIQMNTLEQLPVSIVSSWLLTLVSGDDRYGAVASGTWTFGRILFWLGYPEKRAPGFLLSAFTSVASIIGTAYLVSKK